VEGLSVQQFGGGSALADALAAIALPPRAEPLVLPWPAPDRPGAFLLFDRPDEWREFVLGLDLDFRIPLIARAKFARALRLLYLAWIDFDLIKAAELVAMTALELALIDRFPGPGKPPAFGVQLKLLVERDGLTDADIPMIVRCGGTAVGRISGATKPSLREIRNGLAHGDPFDGLPHAGLVELVRDLIEFAYRGYLAEADLPGVNDGPRA
jgi:hypothetical protein